MEAVAIRESDFLELNGQRSAALRALLEATERATELCNVWLGSGHAGDYRAWQTQLRWLEEADRQYRSIPGLGPE